MFIKTEDELFVEVVLCGLKRLSVSVVEEFLGLVWLNSIYLKMQQNSTIGYEIMFTFILKFYLLLKN